MCLPCGRDVLGTWRFKVGLFGYLSAGGFHTYSEVRSAVSRYLSAAGRLLPAVDMEEVFRGNVEGFVEWVDDLYSDVDAVSNRDMELRTFNLVAMSYISLAEWPHMRDMHLPDAVACEYMAHIAVLRGDPGLVEEAYRAARAVRSRISTSLGEVGTREP